MVVCQWWVSDGALLSRKVEVADGAARSLGLTLTPRNRRTLKVYGTNLLKLGFCVESRLPTPTLTW
jgi:hypothetical protein